MEWSPQQDAALMAVRKWLKDKNGPQIFRLFGWAGTGKTTLAIELAKGVKAVEFAAFTGKAALVMRKKGCTGAKTIHSLIYKGPEDDDGDGSEDKPTRSRDELAFKINWGSKAKDADLIIVDEVSMVNEELAKDLLRFGRKVLVLGDPFQLPPVSGEGFFTQNVEPDIMLTEIHRQAADNPIIRMSIDIREGDGRLQRGLYGDSKIIGKDQVDLAELLAADQIIVGKNITRTGYNERLRQRKGLPELPVDGDKIICLRNNKKSKLLNGGIWTIAEIKSVGQSGVIKMLISSEDGPERKKEVKTHLDFFQGKEAAMPFATRRAFDEFTFGYAITCHKSQGSQWDNVYLFDEGYAFREFSRNWRYTAITRAAERITVVV